jgi:4-alpha-glucanotransferase
MSASPNPRRAGVLLHPSSLPGPYGIGDLGPATREWLAWLSASGQRIWQILPLTPVDGSGCPYASPSSFAAEPLLLSIDDLVTDGWLQSAEKPYALRPSGPVDWPAVRERKGAALRLAAERVAASVDVTAWASSRPELRTWALFRALSREYGPGFTSWPEAVRRRDPALLAREEERGQGLIRRELALQWLFDVQWGRVREDATRRGIELWGDVPIFVSGSSADVWANPELFRLDDAGRPTVISGVPPDVFSTDGQLWGHPLYDEGAHRAQGHTWWKARIGRALAQVDRVRIDHFRGFEAVWEVAAGAADARGGHWVPGAGAPLLDALSAAFGRARPDGTVELPFIAEDLGVITDEVRALRDAYGLPGMVILQFAFGPEQQRTGDHPYLPHFHRPNQVCYTGTHDNDTALGHFQTCDDATRTHLRKYFGSFHETGDDPAAWPWPMVKAAWRSVADTAIVPLQDLLALGSEARMNIPGKIEGNWSFRTTAQGLTIDRAHFIADELRLAGR